MKKYIISILLMMPLLLLAQERPKVALVLGGGGAKGAAHVGVLKYIEQSGVPVDMVVGTSIGSIVGGLYTVGYDSNELDHLMCTMRWPLLLTDGFRHHVTRESLRKPIRSRIGALRGDSISALFERLVTARIGDARYNSFDSLPRPFRAMAFDLNGFREVTLASGSLPLAMRASMSIPLAFEPVQLDSMLLLDGGILNNLPVDVARQMGADYVIAIDLTVNQHLDRDNHLEDALGIDGDSLFLSKGRFSPINILNWGVFRPDLTLYQTNFMNADVYIRPNLAGFKAQDFSPKAIAKMISIGESSGREALPELEALRDLVLGIAPPK